jgi:hypothetical protein
MGVLKKAKVTFTCEYDMKDYLNEWATSEKRTLSNLVEMLVADAIAARERPPIPKEPESTKTKRRGKAGG